VLPTLSEESALDNRANFEQVFLLSMRMILFLTIPASVGLMALGEPIIRVVFQRGQFDEASTLATASAMVFYALGLTGHATVEIVDRVFYARHDTRTPVVAAVLAVCVNVVASLVLSGIVRMTLPFGWDLQSSLSFRGLALANSIAALVEAGVLLRLTTVRLPGLSIERLGKPALRIVAASLVMGLPVAWTAAVLGPMVQGYGTPGEAALLAVCVGGGAALYALASLAFHSDEVLALWRLVRR
jgi:putative peptidoglycan lipid II flippase